VTESGATGGRAAGLVAGGIFVSRVIGFVRDRTFAHFFGDDAAADAYNAAIRIPNIVRNLLGEGALSASFIPVYSAMLAKADPPQARALANSVLALLLAATSLLTVVGITVAPVITALVATGLDPERYELTTRLVRVLFPMTAVMVLSAWCLGVQNSHRLFFNAYASAALWSVAQIALLVAWGPRAATLAELAWWLAWATLAGSLLQVLAQLPQVLPLVRPIHLTPSLSTPGVRETLRNFVPVVTALGLFQISSLIDLQIASWLPTGAIADLGYAQRLYLVPIALFGLSVAASSLPEFSRETTDVALDALRERLRGGWVRILFYVVPTTAVFLAYGDLVVGLLYRSGRFGLAEQRIVHLILGAYALGLVGYSSVRLLASAFYAMQDYRTPLRAALLSIAVGTAASVLLVLPNRDSLVGAAALAFGSAAFGSYVNLATLVRGLRRRLGPLYTPAMRVATWRIVGATAVATAGVVPARWMLREQHVALTAAVILPLFGVIFLTAAHRWGSTEASRWLRRLRLLR
jgi:putative peptidoglycan lipid II flippase